MRILTAGKKGFSQFLEAWSRRGETGLERVARPVRHILKQVREKGDPALFSLTQKYDGWLPSPQHLRVFPRELKAAFQSLGRGERRTLEIAAERLVRFHVLQLQKSWLFAEEEGTILGQRIRPLERVGIYVPGGKASYPSSVLMNAIPAKVAGVPEIIMTCPAPRGRLTPAVLAAAHVAGIQKVFKVGGAQAIAAMAFGTSLIPKVDKIVGPGNLYVAVAKRMVFGEVAIDSIAGPSEILIIADRSSDPSCLAADLIAQAEHDEQAGAVLLCLSSALAREVSEEVGRQLPSLPRREIAQSSLENYGAILVVRNLGEAVQIANRLAPEHLELAVADPFSLVERIKNAGAIFLGHFSPEAIGDYVAGPNHILPTGGTARFSSPLGVYDFIKRSSLIGLSPDGLKKLSGPGMEMARMENLEGHRRSIARRETNGVR